MEELITKIEKDGEEVIYQGEGVRDVEDVVYNKKVGLV